MRATVFGVEIWRPGSVLDLEERVHVGLLFAFGLDFGQGAGGAGRCDQAVCQRGGGLGVVGGLFGQVSEFEEPGLGSSLWGPSIGELMRPVRAGQVRACKHVSGPRRETRAQRRLGPEGVARRDQLRPTVSSSALSHRQAPGASADPRLPAPAPTVGSPRVLMQPERARVRQGLPGIGG